MRIRATGLARGRIPKQVVADATLTTLYNMHCIALHSTSLLFSLDSCFRLGVFGTGERKRREREERRRTNSFACRCCRQEPICFFFKAERRREKRRRSQVDTLFLFILSLLLTAPYCWAVLFFRCGLCVWPMST